MSANDTLTLVLALAAVIVSIVALIINNSVDKRAARVALTDLAVEVSKKATKFKKLYDAEYAEQPAATAAPPGQEPPAQPPPAQQPAGQEPPAQPPPAQQPAAQEPAGQEPAGDTAGQEIDSFPASQRVTALVGQADFLVDRLKPGRLALMIPFLARKPRFPEPVAITLAEALELTHDYWWADRYWAIASSTGNRFLQARTISWWGMALCGRYEYQRGRGKVAEAFKVLDTGLTDPHDVADACILKGEICDRMAGWDTDMADKWKSDARRYYGQIPKEDERYLVYSGEDPVAQQDDTGD